MNGLNGANIGAGTTIGAQIRINYINIPFGDSFYGAFIYAGTTSGTQVRINFVCHNTIIFKINAANIEVKMEQTTKPVKKNKFLANLN